MDPRIAKFSTNLFWDTDPETLDLEAHRAYLVQRVLERGTLADWWALRRCYPVDLIVKTAMGLRSLEPTALSLVACVGNVPREGFRCSIWKRSHPVQHWIS